MAVATTSKLTAEDAQELLESLQQIGDGWYRAVANAVKMNAHKALNMERREFAARIGQRLVDPRVAIIELTKEGHSPNAIADILGVSRSDTVEKVLVAEGLMEPKQLPPSRSGRTESAAADGSTGENPPQRTEVDALKDKLAEERQAHKEKLKELRDARSNEADRLRDEVDDLKEKVAQGFEMTKESRERLAMYDARERESEIARKKREAGVITEADEQRRQKELDAQFDEMRERLKAPLAPLEAGGVVSALNTATETLRKMRARLTPDLISLIEEAHNEFETELDVARFTTTTGETE